MSNSDLPSSNACSVEDVCVKPPSGCALTTISQLVINVFEAYTIFSVKNGEPKVLGHVYVIADGSQTLTPEDTISVFTDSDRRQLMEDLREGRITDCILSLGNAYHGFGKFKNIWRNEVDHEA
jgi:hypothetical protein